MTKFIHEQEKIAWNQSTGVEQNLTFTAEIYEYMNVNSKLLKKVRLIIHVNLIKILQQSLKCYNHIHNKIIVILKLQVFVLYKEHSFLYENFSITQFIHDLSHNPCS